MSIHNKKPETVSDVLSKINFSRFEKLYLSDEECFNLS